MLSLTGKTVLVSGAAKRLGAAAALELAEAGAHVAVHYRGSAEDAARVADAARGKGVRACAVQADLADTPGLGDFFGRVVDAIGPVDFLVNNASIFPKDGVRDFTPEALDANLRINTLAPALLARHFAAQDRPGAIINMLDTMIMDYDRTHAAYHLSKRMLFTLTRMLAVELAPRIRVNGVAPGLVLPPEGEGPEYLEKLKSSNPLQSHGAPGDVCAAILYLLRADFVTGQVLFVDGGRNLRGSMYG